MHQHRVQHPLRYPSNTHTRNHHLSFSHKYHHSTFNHPKSKYQVEVEVLVAFVLPLCIPHHPSQPA